MRSQRLANIKSKSQFRALLLAVIFGSVGTWLVWSSHAATPTVAIEAEAGTPSTSASSIADNSASGGQAIKFNAPAQTGQMVPDGVSGNWTLTFDDEFNGTTLDTTKWSNCWFSPSCGSMNNVTTSPSNVSVSGGNLILTLASSSSGALVSTNPSGGATTGYQFQNGVVEARVYFPGDGTHCYNWPAWWTDGKSWPADGENDIAEILSGAMTTNYHSPSGSHNQGSAPGYWCDGFHTYTMDRETGQVNVYFDGTKVKSYTTDDDGGPEYLVLNVGYSSSYPVYGTASQVKVDYVRAWQ